MTATPFRRRLSRPILHKQAEALSLRLLNKAKHHWLGATVVGLNAEEEAGLKRELDATCHWLADALADRFERAVQNSAARKAAASAAPSAPAEPLPDLIG